MLRSFRHVRIYFLDGAFHSDELHKWGDQFLRSQLEQGYSKGDLELVNVDYKAWFMEVRPRLRLAGLPLGGFAEGHFFNRQVSPSKLSRELNNIYEKARESLFRSAEKKPSLILGTKKAPSLRVAIGYSMGGRILLELTRRLPGLFQAVFCISAHVGLKTASEKWKRWEQDLRWAERWLKKDAQFFKKWYSQKVFEGSSLDERAKQQWLIQLSGEDLFFWYVFFLMNSLAHQDDFRQGISQNILLSSVHQTTVRQEKKSGLPKKFTNPKYFFYVGGQDIKFKNLYAQMNRKKKVDVIPGAGHKVFMDAPEELCKAVSNSLRKHVLCREV